MNKILNNFKYIEFIKESNKADYNFESILDYKQVVCNYDWLITVDKNDNVIKYNNSYDPRAKKEMEEVLLIIPVKQVKKKCI